MPQIAIIGAGPAGLIAAEVLGSAGHDVILFDRMPSPARKFLLAGRGGLNLTHAEASDRFVTRYGEAADWIAPMIDAFSPADLRAWCEGLGQDVFVGTSGRVFPVAMKAAPLLRAWLRRLEERGVRFRGRHCWLGFGPAGQLRFKTPAGEETWQGDAVLLALGGASWPRLGSDGGWTSILRDRGITVTELRPANCGICVAWSPVFLARCEGLPLKRIRIEAAGRTSQGDAVVTRHGLEGGAVYALSAVLRDAIGASGSPEMIHIDLRPDIPVAILEKRLAVPRQGRSLGNFLRQHGGLLPPAVSLVQWAIRDGAAQDRLGALVKAVPLRVTGVQPIERAISTAGGIGRKELDGRLMLAQLPGVFAAGEMLDWEAPTGGYLLQACFSAGVWAANGILAWLQHK